jgi:glycyl-tRNA synthetase beta subunit
MAKRSKKGHRSQAKMQGYVVVTFAEDLEQAREYKTLLEVNDVSAIISEQQEQSLDSKEIAVMVPEDFLDEAHVIIESQQAYDDFYDYALEDEENGDFDDELFEDDF